jgi:hypothetical protein
MSLILLDLCLRKRKKYVFCFQGLKCLPGIAGDHDDSHAVSGEYVADLHGGAFGNAANSGKFAAALIMGKSNAHFFQTVGSAMTLRRTVLLQKRRSYTLLCQAGA